ncbi:DNA-binding response regulator [Bacillaceae bacterium SIJ1]|uniref:LuxR C-terminal-related transcriptional regulator n=1 Tax=Litoribacterium kuwaitense TaxID=1398745 RepID=UPI0013ED3952|nr:LuxR C-terminal-related transcriptional regulator [Litoribacterium kuwaitense]NGP45986.1 DNA-binding response regulator [Litoribacterium kuwaitense]
MNKQEIAQLLKDYHWMVNEIKRQRELLKDFPGATTGKYGIEATQPKAPYQTGDPVAREVERRYGKYKWVEKLEQRVTFVQERIHVIQAEREKAVLECMLDGMSMVAISRHMGLSERHVFRLRDSVVDKMSGMSGMSGLAG